MIAGYTSIAVGTVSTDRRHLGLQSSYTLAPKWRCWVLVGAISISRSALDYVFFRDMEITPTASWQGCRRSMLSFPYVSCIW